MNVIDDLRKFLASKGILKTDCVVADDESLLASGVIDSLVVLELTSYIQIKYDVQIDEDDLIPENFESLLAMSSYIESKSESR